MLQARAPEPRYLHSTLSPLCNAASTKPKRQSCAWADHKQGLWDVLSWEPPCREAQEHGAQLLSTFPLAQCKGSEAETGDGMLSACWVLPPPPNTVCRFTGKSKVK